MSFKLLGGGSTLDTIVNDMNQNILELKNRELTEIFKDDDGVRRVLLGKGASGFYGLKVSPPGVDVFTATDAQLAFNSNQNVFKIVKTGTFTMPSASASPTAGNWGSGSSTITVPHGLGYAPVIIAYISDGTAYDPLPTALMTSASTSTVSWSSYRVSVDGTNIYGTNSVTAFGTTVLAVSNTVKYYCLVETAS